MDILPAIDLLEGRCVRLVQGSYDRVIRYECDPLEAAQRFKDAGATWVHVVDLDGARAGRVANLEALQSLSASGLHVQFGGGIRDDDEVGRALDAGAARVIVGTRAFEDFDWFRGLVHRETRAGRIVLGLDARLGRTAIHGRTQATELSAAEVAESVAGWPLAAIVYTDIGRDGMLLGPNVQAIRNLASIANTPVIASGGVTDLSDVERLSRIDLAGIVIGRALYENTIDLAAALQAARSA